MKHYLPAYAWTSLFVWFFLMGSVFAVDMSQTHQTAIQLFSDGNYQESLDKFAEVAKEPTADPNLVVTAVEKSLECQRQLGQQSKMDTFLESVAATHTHRWEVLSTCAQAYLNCEHYGFLVAGEFERGQHRGDSGKVVNSFERDRVRALQLYERAYHLLAVRSQPRTEDQLRVFEGWAGAVLSGREATEAWRLQSLTRLEELPDYEEGWNRRGSSTGASVDASGTPVFYDAPDSWENAANDGQRWRWIWAQAVGWFPEHRSTELLARAGFLQSQFGEQTLADYGWWFGRQEQDEKSKGETGTFALHTLQDNETIARLATGVKRFALPDTQNYVKLFQQAAAEQSSAQGGWQLAEWENATTALASIYENRRQYPRAAEYWQKLTVRGATQAYSKERLAQIVGNWGRLEPVSSQPTGVGATVDFRYRNGKRVEFVARRINVQKLLSDVKGYLKGNPNNLEWQRLQIEDLGYRLVTQRQEEFVGEEVARWGLDLDPLADHFDRRITVTTPLQDAGAYLVTATVENGNTTSVVLWINDTAIVKKPLQGQSLYYVADSNTGQPLGKCNVEFFGYWQEHIDGNRYRIQTKNFAEHTDANGLVSINADETNRRYQWLVIATTPAGRLAYLGFRPVWSGDYYDQQYQQVKVFSITDRPVYRPGQKLYYKFWVAHAQYDMADESHFAAKTFQVEIRDPHNEQVFTTQLTSDLYGGLEGEWEVPAGATLGQYQINVVNHGGGTFRVEEYKKPEFEVTVEAPTEPVALGQKVTARIAANYYFGAPVTEATVHYKVLRTSYSQQWYPPSPWDWLYGPGYGWFGQDYLWYPGWSRWGCIAPSPWWFWRAPETPEVVSEQEVPIGPDGTVSVDIDTSLAKQFHPDQDHSYQIQAEVVDQSRRMIVGTGQVLVARQPFQVMVWTDRGHYRTADTVTVSVSARTLAGKPVEGTGKLRLLKIVYEDAKPVETEVGTWELGLKETGQADLAIKAADPGQYRLSYELTDSKQHTIEGGQVFTIAGPSFDGSQFQFNDLEVIPDRRDYRPGEKALLQINSNRAGTSVLLFLRPANGVYQPPQMVHLTGKSTTVEVEVTAKDTPNFFVEAVTVHGGRMHSVVRELFVPPAGRMLNLQVVSDSAAYLPGQQAKVVLKLTDLEGKPFVGSLALAVYDKALDYIAGGSNVADIREFFWKWRRNHNLQADTNLQAFSPVFPEPDKPNMNNLGIFGETVVNEVTNGPGQAWFGRHNRFSGGRMMLGVEVASALPMSAAMADESGMVNDTLGFFDSPAEKSPVPAKPPGTSAEIEPVVRQNFADTAFWKSTLETNAEGIAEVEFPLPENLTTWKVKAWGLGHGTQVGEGSAEVVTRKNLLVRLQAPRFFVERDEVVLSAIVHNYLENDKSVRVRLELEGDTLADADEPERVVEVPADGEQRVDWRVKVAHEGSATIRMSARTDEESDAVQMTFPVLVHGMLKTESFTGVIRSPQTSGEFTCVVPEERRPEQSRLEIRYTPTLAGAMVDALPYLIDYPYGCTEQTLNRFLPAVITQKTLQEMDLDLAAINQKRTNLNAQEIGDDRQRAAGWKRFDRNPVFDEAELSTIVKAGVNRLTEMQLSDGGWGWFSGWGEQSTPHTTAVVVHGLQVAEQNGVALVPGVLERGRAWLETYQAEQIRLIENYEADQQRPVAERGKQSSKPFADNLDALVYMVLVERVPQEANPVESVARSKMRDFLYRDRTKLAVYSLATYGYALHLQGEAEKLAMVMRNLRQYVRQDDENQTAWLDLPDSGWWYWYGSEYEAHAYYLKLLSATEPQNPVASRMVKYLLNNRKHSTYWNSTRDTALVIEAFAAYLRATGEMAPDVTIEVWIDGKQRKSVHVTHKNLFTFDNKLVIAGDELTTGRHTVELRKQGESPVYFNAYLTNFTLEEDITAAGLELKVARRYFRLSPTQKTGITAGGHGQVVEQREEEYDRSPIKNLAELTSGDLVEVELTVDSKNDYEYVVLEDMKGSGLEPVEVRSGYNGNELGAYVEYRDERVVLFARTLARGRHSITYRLRAEIPGQFHILPTRASAMYAPELKANSDELQLRVSE